MLNTQWRQWLSCIPMSQPRHTHRGKRQRQRLVTDAAAEVLEGRELLTATPVVGPYLAFAVQPQNNIAGHPVHFSVDAMINVKTGFGTIAEVDTAYNGTCIVNAIGPGSFDYSLNYQGPHAPNSPLGEVVITFNGGVAGQFQDFAALDVAGKYRLSAIANGTPPSANLPAVLSNSFTISPFTATDRLVFLKAPSETTVDAPFSATVAAEDQFGNIDTGVNNVPVTLYAIPGNTSTAELKNGEATFNDAFFVVDGGDTLLAVATLPSGAALVGTDIVQVV